MDPNYEIDAYSQYLNQERDQEKQAAGTDSGLSNEMNISHNQQQTPSNEQLKSQNADTVNQ